MCRFLIITSIILPTGDAKTRNDQCVDYEVLSLAEALQVDNPSMTHILEPATEVDVRHMVTTKCPNIIQYDLYKLKEIL